MGRQGRQGIPEHLVGHLGHLEQRVEQRVESGVEFVAHRNLLGTG